MVLPHHSGAQPRCCGVQHCCAWALATEFCDKQSLGRLACVSKRLKNEADNSIGWKLLCQDLWKCKQNHPLEMWVRLPPSESESEFRPSSSLDGFGSVSSCSEADMDREIADLEGQRAAIQEQMGKIRRVFAECRETAKLCLETDQLNIFRSVYDHIQTLTDQIQRLRSIKLQQCHYSTLLERACWSESISTHQTEGDWNVRAACPVSRAVLAECIRDHEWRYCDVVRRAKVVREELGHCDGSGIDAQRQRARLAAHLRQLEGERDELQERAARSFDEPPDLGAALARYKREGRLLSWRDSYLASVVDSHRTHITYEELREQGDWLILFGNVLETLRFVQGGRMLIDDRSFCSEAGPIDLCGETFHVPRVGGSGTIHRSPIDWGWELVCFRGFVRFASFDRERGVEAHEGALSRSPAGKKWAPAPLRTPLRHQAMHALYLS